MGRSSNDELSPSPNAFVGLKHPKTLRAYERRMEAVLTRRKPLQPFETQEFRHACIGDFDRLSQPQFRRQFRKRDLELVAQQKQSSSHRVGGAFQDCSNARTNRPGSSFSYFGKDRTSSSWPEEGAVFRGSEVFATSLVELDEEPLITNKDRQKMIEEERLARMVAPVGPSRKAVDYAKEKEERLDRSRVSQRLFHAIHGQALEKVVEKSNKKTDAANFTKVFSAQNNNNSIFITESHMHVAGTDGGVVDDPTASPTARTIPPLSKYADPAFRATITNITSREYLVLRQLFVEIDEDRSGFLELHELMNYQKMFPRRLGQDVLEHLPLEIDGKIFLDDFILAHFPNVDKSTVEQLMTLHEPKVQASVTSLAPESLKAITRSHQTILERFGQHTLQNWIAVNQAEQAGGADYQTPGGVSSGAYAARKRRTSLALSGFTSQPQQLTPTSEAQQQQQQQGNVTAGAILSTINAYQFYLHMNAGADLSIVDFVNICKLRQLQLKPVMKHEAIASGMFIPPGTFESAITVANGKKEPNVPYLLACPIAQKDFLVLVSDYYAMCQSNESVNTFNPNFRDQLEAWRWEKLFPHTGSVRNYFKQRQ